MDRRNRRQLVFLWPANVKPEPRRPLSFWCPANVGKLQINTCMFRMEPLKRLFLAWLLLNSPISLLWFIHLFQNTQIDITLSVFDTKVFISETLQFESDELSPLNALYLSCFFASSLHRNSIRRLPARFQRHRVQSGPGLPSPPSTPAH